MKEKIKEEIIVIVSNEENYNFRYPFDKDINDFPLIKSEVYKLLSELKKHLFNETNKEKQIRKLIKKYKSHYISKGYEANELSYTIYHCFRIGIFSLVYTPYFEVKNIHVGEREILCKIKRNYLDSVNTKAENIIGKLLLNEINKLKKEEECKREKYFTKEDMKIMYPLIGFTIGTIVTIICWYMGWLY